MGGFCFGKKEIKKPPVVTDGLSFRDETIISL